MPAPWLVPSVNTSAVSDGVYPAQLFMGFVPSRSDES
jgi:hypothetical protein